jgi:hypothetical protein
MFVSPFASGNGRPQHRAERGINRREISVDSARHKASQIGHFTGLQKRANDLPISGIPTNEQYAGFRHKWRKAFSSLKRARTRAQSDSNPAIWARPKRRYIQARLGSRKGERYKVQRTCYNFKI